jgi:branched-chain amino acid transport system substrate-binding protein
MEFVERYKKANAGAYPDSWAVMAYESLYLYKAAAEKAKSVDSEAVIKAMEGTTVDMLRGPYTIRPLDHMGTVPCYQGTIAKVPEYPFKIWKDLSRIPGDQVIRPEAEVREIWKKTGVQR